MRTGSGPRLVDANVWLALLAPSHEHHAPVRDWYDTLEAGQAGLCRLVHLAVIRLLSNPKVMGPSVITTREAWDVLDSLMDDERVEMWAEPAGLAGVMPKLLRYPVPTPNMVTDAYLAAFAIARECRLATIDGGFDQFAGLRVERLAAAVMAG
ncbi:MAG: TA system VapC family ribonuclease toxin [Bryobacteraceae bacterium]